MDNSKDLAVHVMRSELGRARGMGSAKSGVRHWWGQRVTAVALVPLSLWFIYNLLMLGSASYEVMIAWASGTWNQVLLLTLTGMMFYHMQLGLQVVIEDYMHNDSQRLITLLLMKGATVLLAVAAIISILKLGL